jgi:hypothetical protein
MNQQLINNKSSIQQFIMKSIVTAVTILMIYYLTIASFITRTVSFIDKVEPVLVQLEKIEPTYIADQLKILWHHLLKRGPNSPQGFTYYYENFADRMENISGEKKNRLRESTRKILIGLSPIFDEQVEYYKTNILHHLDQ